MKVFAHYYDSDETGNNYRWRTLLQFGASWDIIGSVVMKNPGRAEPHNYVHESTTLKQLERFPEPDYGIYSQRDYFSSDDTLQKVEKLFCAYYKTATLKGVIKVFNLMNVRDPNLEQALIKNNKATYPFSKTIESDIKSLVAPVYLGWGDLWKKARLGEIRDVSLQQSPCRMYTWIGYQMAYLKANYPNEFAEVISSKEQ